MAELAKRIETLESRILADDGERTEGVFMYVVDGRKDAPPPEPVKGWRYDGHRIMREGNKTDDELNRRAIAEVKPTLGKDVVPVFYSINEWSN